MDDIIQIKVGEQTKEIKMSFGLLNELAKKVGDIDAVPMLNIDPDLREGILTSVLSERDGRGNITEPVNLFQLDMDPEDAILLVEWVGAHILDFFLKSLEKTKTLMEDQEERIKALMPTSSGSQA